MRARTGARTENANRRPALLAATTTLSTGLATATALVAAPVLAAPVDAPAEHTGGAVRPPVPLAAEEAAQVSDGDHTDVRELAVPQVRQERDAAGAGRQVVARLQRRVTSDFGLLGLTWRHGSAPRDVEVQVRTRGVGGWSDWRELHVHPGEGPTPKQESGVTRDGTEPLWVGDADGVQVRVLSAQGTAPEDLEVTLVDPGVGGTASPALAEGHDLGQSASGAAVPAAPAVLAGSSTALTATTVASDRPRMVSRRGWGADPRLRDRCDAPRRARTVKMTFVHHTAGSNNYTRAESPAIVRSIYAYHTQGRGWCDIGYNFLVDRFGTVYIGRAGGPNLPVRGAHAGEYNTGSSGVSLMGNFEEARPTRAMKRGLTRLLAWKLSSYYRFPRTSTRLSGERFETISGHRDAMSTACPGRYVYQWLPRLRDRVTRRARPINTPIRQRWGRLFRDGVNLGPVYRGESAAADGGRRTQFQGSAWIYWNDGPGAHAVWGRIHNRYRTLGRAGGHLGYPRTGLWNIRGHRGKAQTFQHGRIFRTPQHGAEAVWRRIDRRYRKWGSAGGRLGVPVRGQHRTSHGWAARFEHGEITWNTSTGRVRVRTY